jgi:hypothetical protein
VIRQYGYEPTSTAATTKASTTGQEREVAARTTFVPAK